MSIDNLEPAVIAPTRTFFSTTKPKTDELIARIQRWKRLGMQIA